MDVFGYCRVSTVVQEREGYSLEEQKERIEAYCKAMNWNLLKVFVDGGESGAKLNRPALEEMTQKIKLAQKVVVYKLDRLSRSQKDTLYLIEDVFLKNGCDFVSITENFDTSTPFGKAMVGILAVFAQLEREQIRERMMMGKEARVKEGKYCGQFRTAIGYDYIDGKLQVTSDAWQVKEIFERVIAGDSFNGISRDFVSRGISHKYGDWSRFQVKSTVTNPVYTGKVRFNDELYDGNHEAIVSQEVFDKANEIANRRTEEWTFVKRGGTPASYLSGLLVCGRCGKRFYKRQDSHCYPKYVCQGRSYMSETRCDNKRWQMGELDEIVLNEVRKLKLNPPKPPEIKKVDMSAEIAKVDKQLERLLDLYTSGMYSVEILKEKTDSLNKKKLSLLSQKQETQKDYRPLLRSFDDVIKNGSLDDVRAVLFELIDHIIIDGENVDIHWRF